MKKISGVFVATVYFIVYTGLISCGIVDCNKNIYADTVPLQINNRSSYSNEHADQSDVLPYMEDFLSQYIIKGDINGDGKVDLIDLTLLSQWLLNDIEFTHEQMIAADVVYENYSQGEPDIADLATMKQIICKDYVSLKFDPEQMAYISR